MFSHAPADYNCPFCSIVDQCKSADIEESPNAIVYHNDIVTALVPLHHFANIKGNVMIIPNEHYENIFDIDHEIGSELLRVTQVIACAMKEAYNCEGISTRQHNEPAGNQDAWHYHLHVFPRYTKDQLYLGAKARYEQEERLYHASLLRQNIKHNRFGIEIPKHRSI